ncbi:MAG TPA: hypothetical protein VNS10_11635 [Gemmatimonadaceae bacterium]|jgi:hypothetical protein|nr:hypothetical protein [Gemmatimonadaceae bacterium]
MPTRRDFLASAASTGLLAALPVDRSLPPHAGERPNAPAPPFALDDTDLSWVSRLRGTSRAVFDSPAVSEGGALFRAVLWRKQINKAFGTPIEDVTPVIVFRHMAIPMVMDDAFWEHLGIGKDLKIKDPKTDKWVKRNPWASAEPDAKGSAKDYTIPAFIQSGGIVLACGLAFGEIIYQYTQKDKLSQADAEKRAREHLIPGIVLQPSGFFAVLKAQDEGCKFFLGS